LTIYQPHIEAVVTLCKRDFSVEHEREKSGANIQNSNRKHVFIIEKRNRPLAWFGDLMYTLNSFDVYYLV